MTELSATWKLLGELWDLLDTEGGWADHREAVHLLIDVAERADKTCGGWTEVLALREFDGSLRRDAS